MLRAVVRAFGDPRQVIGLEEVERPAPGPGEVEIRIHRAAINPSDLIPVTGAYRSRTTLPFVPGFEGVGEIVRIGEDIGEACPPLSCRTSPPQGGDRQTAMLSLHPQRQRQARRCLLQSPP
ncbi:UNVERIFIED_ORG: alcohol dehydrogenase catalytic domain-containing protein [Roseateles sp. XES5]|nr:alcohol dehydrogenase catalytic domain-containing protein [Roseateles sp. XES5]